MRFKGFHWVDMVGGIILGVAFGIEPQHKSLWRRSPAGSFFFKKKRPLPGKPEESSPSWFLPKIHKSEFSSINLSFYPTPMDATDTFYPMGPLKPHF